MEFKITMYDLEEMESKLSIKIDELIKKTLN